MDDRCNLVANTKITGTEGSDNLPNRSTIEKGIADQPNPCMSSEAIFATISYCTIFYLLYQKFLNPCAYW